MSDDPQPRTMRYLFPIVAAGAAWAMGVVTGSGLTWAVQQPVERVVETPRELDAVELDQVCESRVDGALEQVREATAQIDVLEAEVDVKAAKVAALEAEMKKRAASGRAFVKQLEEQLEQAKVELAAVRAELQQALADKAEVEQKLEQTHARLVAQAIQTDEARAEVRDGKWSNFLARGQLQICEKGNRRKLGRCRESVEAALKPFHDRYEHCLASGQEPPQLREAASVSDAALPPFAAWMAPEDRVVRGWYVLLCDPALPSRPTSAADIAVAWPEDDGRAAP